MTSQIIRTVLLFLFAGSSVALAQHGPPPVFSNERFVIRAMAQINGAQATYFSTVGNGSYGSMSQLRDAGFIDASLASGSKHGYNFVLTLGQNVYTVSATPIRYKKSGLWSYYVDQRGMVLGGDRMGQPTGPADGVYVDTCAMWGLADNERCAIQALRTIHGAEMTYASTAGNGFYCHLVQLGISNLIDPALASGAKHGYLFTISFGSNPQPYFQIYAKPTKYGTTGRRGFFIDQTGVIRGADHGGLPGEPDDPPINK